MLPMGATEIVLADTFGFGFGSIPALLTPHTIGVSGSAFASPVQMTLQAVTFDTASPLTLGLTNALDLIVDHQPPPQIADTTPFSVWPGTMMNVHGSGFLAGLSLTLNGTSVPVTWISPELIAFTAPTNSGCNMSLVLTNPDAQSASTTLNPPPTITNTANTSGSAGGGTQLYILGGPFPLGTTVTVGGTPATVTVLGGFGLVVTTPPGLPGIAPVVVTTPVGCIVTTAFTYN